MIIACLVIRAKEHTEAAIKLRRLCVRNQTGDIWEVDVEHHRERCVFVHGQLINDFQDAVQLEDKVPRLGFGTDRDIVLNQKHATGDTP